MGKPGGVRLRKKAYLRELNKSLMKTLSLFATALCLSVSLHAQVTDSYKETLHEMFRVSGTEDTYHVAIEQMLGIFREQYAHIDIGTWEELKMEITQASIDDLTEMLAPVYAKHLTEEDLQGMIAFYETPLGKKYAMSNPLIVQESMQVGQAWGRQIGEDFVRKMKERGY